ncbi:hypothetical protein B0H12DRAFT_413182 [Mycena haematopus]|nr:hypothetical protein B0H12DRAFT_413182 [Mycena haematopus]
MATQTLPRKCREVPRPSTKHVSYQVLDEQSPTILTCLCARPGLWNTNGMEFRTLGPEIANPFTHPGPFPILPWMAKSTRCRVCSWAKSKDEFVEIMLTPDKAHLALQIYKTSILVFKTSPAAATREAPQRRRAPRRRRRREHPHAIDVSQSIPPRFAFDFLRNDLIYE